MSNKFKYSRCFLKFLFLKKISLFRNVFCILFLSVFVSFCTKIGDRAEPSYIISSFLNYGVKGEHAEAFQLVSESSKKFMTFEEFEKLMLNSNGYQDETPSLPLKIKALDIDLNFPAIRRFQVQLVKDYKNKFLEYKYFTLEKTENKWYIVLTNNMYPSLSKSFEQEDFANTLKICHKILEVDPFNHQALLYQTWCSYVQNDYHRSHQLLGEYCLIFPTYNTCLLNNLLIYHTGSNVDTSRICPIDLNAIPLEVIHCTETYWKVVDDLSNFGDYKSALTICNEIRPSELDKNMLLTKKAFLFFMMAIYPDPKFSFKFDALNDNYRHTYANKLRQARDLLFRDPEFLFATQKERNAMLISFFDFFCRPYLIENNIIHDQDIQKYKDSFVQEFNLNNAENSNSPFIDSLNLISLSYID